MDMVKDTAEGSEVDTAATPALEAEADKGIYKSKYFILFNILLNSIMLSKTHVFIFVLQG